MRKTGALVPLADKTVLERQLAQMTQNGERVLALAISPQAVPKGVVPEGLTLIGLLSIRDQVRPEARKAVQQVQRPASKWS